MRTTGKQCGLAATGVYQPSLRSPWLAAADYRYPALQADQIKHWDSSQSQQYPYTKPSVNIGFGFGSGGYSNIGIGIGF